ncbi:MAG: hypothetical protein ACTMIY_11030 [Microbacterium gubbeenense]
MAPHQPPLLDELTSETMLDLPMSARLLWALLSSRPQSPDPLRLNLKRLKAAAFPFDGLVSVDSLMMDVLLLEERGLIVTSVGEDGRERYQLLPRKQEAPWVPKSLWETATELALQPAPSEHIASVVRERESEREGVREPRPPARPDLTPPARYCADHMPHGPGRESCVLCMQARQAGLVWLAFVKNGQTPPADLSAPPVDTYAERAPEPPSTPQAETSFGFRRRPRFGPSDPLSDPESSDYISTDHLPY